MHLPTTTQILLLSSLLALTSAGPLPTTLAKTTLATTSATTTDTTSPTPIPINHKRQAGEAEVESPVHDEDAEGNVLPSAEESSAEIEADVHAAQEGFLLDSDGAKVKRQGDYPGAGEHPDFSDTVVVTHEQNPSHDMIFPENIGP